MCSCCLPAVLLELIMQASLAFAFALLPKVGAYPNLGPAAATVPDRLARYAFDRHVAGCLVGECAVHGWLLRLSAESMVSVLLPFVSAGGRRTEPAKAFLLRIIAKWAPVLGEAHYINSAMPAASNIGADAQAM